MGRLMISSVIVLLFGISSAAVQANESLLSQASEGAKVYFIEPHDGAIVSQTFSVKFGLVGMGVAPAGVDRQYTGHHHILINLDKLPAMDKPLPANDNVLHFGAGQTETQITLPRGEHTLQLLLGNYVHIPHSPAVISEKITIHIE